MPFDGKNFQQTKPEVFSLEGLVAWLETQPADGQYSYMDNCDCLVAQYLKASGIELQEDRSRGPVGVSYVGFHDQAGKHHPLPVAFDEVALRARPKTFGAALSCARKLLAAR